MWDAVTAVNREYDPIIYEGTKPLAVVVTNSGPATVKILAWDKTCPAVGAKPVARLELRLGDSKAVRGCLVRAHLSDPDTQPIPFAAIGWRIRE